MFHFHVKREKVYFLKWYVNKCALCSFFSHHCCRDEDITESLAEIIDALAGVKITASKNYSTVGLLSCLEFINEIILSPVASCCFHICLENDVESYKSMLQENLYQSIQKPIQPKFIYFITHMYFSVLG